MEQNDMIREFHRLKIRRLLLCLLIDLIGSASYLFPVIGDFSDVLWGPISGIVLFLMFGGKGNIPAYFGGIGEMAEELFPGTDFIPTAFLMWVYTYVYNKDKTYSKFVSKHYKHRLLSSTSKTN